MLRHRLHNRKSLYFQMLHFLKHSIFCVTLLLYKSLFLFPALFHFPVLPKIHFHLIQKRSLHLLKIQLPDFRHVLGFFLPVHNHLFHKNQDSYQFDCSLPSDRFLHILFLLSAHLSLLFLHK